MAIITQSTEKMNRPAVRIVLDAHQELDKARIARFSGGRELSLAERLARVTGELLALRQIAARGK